MMLTYRNWTVLVPALPKLSVGALSFDRVPSPVLALALVLSVALAGLTVERIVRVERDLQPALQDTRQLGAALGATQVLLRDSRLGTAESRITRADGQAQRFHLIAARTHSGPRAQMLAYGTAFGEYYVAARRAAVGLSMSADAYGSSVEEAGLGHATLRENLGSGLEAQERAIGAARPATAPIELAGWLSLTLLSAAALLRRRARHQQAARSTATPAMANADYYVPVPASDRLASLRLREAVERLAQRRLGMSAAAAMVAKHNNERQIELARRWNGPTLVLPATQPAAEMSAYEGEQADAAQRFGGLTLMPA